MDFPKILGLYKKPTVPYTHYQNELWKNTDHKDVLEYLRNERGLTDDTIVHFKLGATETGEIAIPIFKDSELIDYKFRDVKQKAFRRWPASETWVFNEEGLIKAAESGKLIITEGEFDTMALWQLGFRSVVSGTGGANGRTEWIARITDIIKTVYLSGDNDEPGQEYTRKLAERIGLQSCYNVVLPKRDDGTTIKDANDFLRAGGTAEEYQKILKKSRRFEVKDVFRLADIIDQVADSKITRLPTFSRNFNQLTDGGVYTGALVTISGRTGVGKSNFMLNFLVEHANAGHPVLLISLENDTWMTVQRVLEIKYRKQIKDFTKEDWERIKLELVEYPFYVDTSMQTYKMEDITTMVEQGKKLYGIEFLGFDHINFLPSRGSNETQELSQMIREFKMLARRNSIVVYMICHVRKVSEDKAYITSDDLKGTSSLGQDSDMVLLLYHTRAGMEMAIDKARASKSHIRLPYVFKGETGEFLDDTERKPVDFSGNEYSFMDEEVAKPPTTPAELKI